MFARSTVKIAVAAGIALGALTGCTTYVGPARPYAYAPRAYVYEAPPTVVYGQPAYGYYGRPRPWRYGW